MIASAVAGHDHLCRAFTLRQVQAPGLQPATAVDPPEKGNSRGMRACDSVACASRHPRGFSVPPSRGPKTMTTHRRRIARARTLLFAAAALAGVGGGRVHAQVWDGEHPNSDDWGSGRNWNPDGPPANDGSANLIMSGTVRLTPNLDQAWDVQSLKFNNSAGAFVIGGSPLFVRGGGIQNASSNVQVFNNKIFPRGTPTFYAFSAPMVFNDLIEGFIGSPNVIVDGPFDVTFNGNLTQSTVTLELEKNGAGTLTLNGSSNNYSGPTTVNAGKLLL